jgi:hypothetical protein
MLLSLMMVLSIGSTPFSLAFGVFSDTFNFVFLIAAGGFSLPDT